ncbi:MAG: hypothetical protein PHD88_03645 [Firmicutes bacterium]|nr:hypothetical protein [Bacillota bacterium]MDD4262872.1 hypothetical protein [Bacillota bacterium]MDD4693484.1 hypothetical protein [Bacillota bacterium]
MRLVYSQINLKNLEINERINRIIQGIERGRKEGADLVVLPLLDYYDLKEALAFSPTLLKGTCDYPDITVLLAGRNNAKFQTVFLLITEGKIIGKADYLSDISNAEALKWSIDLNRCSSLELSILIERPANFLDLDYTRKAYLFLDSSNVLDSLYYKGSSYMLAKKTDSVFVFDF